MIKVVAFDLDNTLWSSDPVIRMAETKLNKWLKQNVPQLKYDTTSMRTLRRSVLEKYPDLSWQVTKLRSHIIAKALMLSGIESSSVNKITTAAMKVFLEARNEIELFDGAIDVIKMLVKKYTVGAITNGNADVHRTLLAPYFSFSFTAEEVGSPKPSADIFYHALSYTNCKAHEMIYVGDDPFLDIDAANYLGAHTVLLTNNEHRTSGKTDATEIIRDIRTLPAAISRIAKLLD